MIGLIYYSHDCLNKGGKLLGVFMQQLWILADGAGKNCFSSHSLLHDEVPF